MSSVLRMYVQFVHKSNKVSQGTQLANTIGYTLLFLCLLLDILSLKQRYCTTGLYTVLYRKVHRSTAAGGACTHVNQLT